MECYKVFKSLDLPPALEYSSAYHTVVLEYLTQLALCDYELGKLESLRDLCEAVDGELEVTADLGQKEIDNIHSKWRAKITSRVSEVWF